MAQRDPFAVLSGSTVLARIPLLPGAGGGSQSAAGDPLLVEGMFIASRQAGATTVAACDAEHDRLAATIRAYELRARFRPTPHGVFAGVAVARVTDGGALILRVCERGASYQTVVAEVVREWPNSPEEMIRSTVLKMVRGGFLLTDLVPESGQAEPGNQANTPGCPVVTGWPS